MAKKVKIFLGAYINQSNAQNLNCLTLAKYLDKSHFDVYALAIRHGNFGKVEIVGVSTFTCFYPVKFTQYIAFIWGIWKCDVAYLPRGNSYKFQKWLLKLFKKPSFKTIENIIDDKALSTALSVFDNLDEVLENYRFTSKLYSITSFMKTYNEKHHNLSSESLILPLATDTELFKIVSFTKKNLADVVFLGSDMKRKGVNDFINLASHFPDLKFHIIGNDSENIVPYWITNYKVKNVQHYGLLPHNEILHVLSQCQLHILPSRSEGFPRGIIECAAAGLPTLTYYGYGAEEWIINNENGFVCHTIEEMKQEILKILNDKSLISELSKGAIELAEKYSARKVTKLYEDVIIDLYNVA
jgi:glycosyltransferase involved in cell wall biosynthesis